jgi:hypothetical protein
VPTSDELAEKTVYSWQRVRPQPTTLPSGKIALSVGDDGPYRAHRRWADRKRWSVEDRLGDVLATVELQAQEKEQRRRVEEEEQQQRHRAWEQAMARVRRRFHDDRRTKLLNEQVEAWELAERIRKFSRAARDSGHADGDWLDWADAHADEIDPTTGFATGPEEIEPQPEDLRPYLGRWSPYGPESR